MDGLLKERGSKYIHGGIPEGGPRAVFNTPGACLDTGMDDDVFMIFWGALDKLMIAVDTTLGRNYISKENNGGALLYVHV